MSFLPACLWTPYCAYRGHSATRKTKQYVFQWKYSWCYELWMSNRVFMPYFILVNFFTKEKDFSLLWVTAQKRTEDKIAWLLLGNYIDFSFFFHKQSPQAYTKILVVIFIVSLKEFYYTWMKHNEINYDTFIVGFAILLLGDIYFIILSFLNMRYFKIIIASEK